METRLLGQKEVGALDNILEVGLAIGVYERCYVRDVDSFRSENTKILKMSLKANN